MEYVDHILTDQSVYKIRDAEAARVDNNGVGQTVWDSKTLVERLCPPFAVSGSEAVCYPVEGYPLSVTSILTAIQEGQGEPSPDNVRTILCCRLLQLQHRSDSGQLSYDCDLEMSVWGGTFRWDTGELEVTDEIFTIDHNTRLAKHPDGKRYYVSGGLPEMRIGNRQKGLCDSLPVIVTNGSTDKPCLALGSGNNYPYLYNMEQLDSSIVDVESLKAYLENHPITFVYPLAEPKRIQLTPTVIAAFAGENRLESSVGETKVSGRKVPAYMQEGEENV